MQKQKSARNKTIDTPLEDNLEFFGRCLQKISKNCRPDDIINKTICGDTFKILPLLPRGFVDLMIVDPPYNLTKNYHGNKFCEQDDKQYEKYTEQWIEAAKPLLKPNASIYVCCDWKSSLVIGNVLKKHFHIQNRITWEREKGRGAKSNWKNSMEDIWFATCSNNYTFNLDAVKIRKKSDCSVQNKRDSERLGTNGGRKFSQHLPVKFLGRYFGSVLVDAGEHRTPDTKARKVDCKTRIGKFKRRRCGF